MRDQTSGRDIITGQKGCPRNRGDRPRSGTRRKRSIYGADLGVLWVLADDAGVDFQLEVVTEQDW